MIIKLTKSEKDKDKYLKINNVGYGIVFLSCIIVLVGILCWLFFGAYNITINGYADVVLGRTTYCVVEAQDIDYVKVGMNINIGNVKGKIIEVEDEYYTYERIHNLYGPMIEKFNLSKNKSYYFVDADINNVSTGIKPFSIVVDTITPFEYYILGDKWDD